ncbi:HPr(Ser) kinase/phosphatase [Virgibacillus sp. W0430]|uniref:HPr(Ser) kinase/phosphatase n=1 Tax=Virgibacillus sp. W0430 TaxID=3391580 RepID=UPI003F4790EF
MRQITVNDLIKTFALETIVATKDKLDVVIQKPQTRRPGLEFIDYMDFLPMEHVHVLGENEIHYLDNLSDEECEQRVSNIVKYKPPCIIVTDDRGNLVYLTKYCRKNNIPLLRTAEHNYEFIKKIDAYMIKNMAPEIAVHGVCINVFGIGILLRGKSGLGKSETAHTLIGRGHRLVADDIVVIKKLSPQTLLGTHNGKNKEFLALRSVGLLNVVRQYGRKAFQDETRIALDIELTTWERNTLNNELEMETKYTEYMDVKVPYIQIQLQPGRDVAGLIEAAANNWYLQQQGYSAAEEFMKRLESDHSKSSWE